LLCTSIYRNAKFHTKRIYKFKRIVADITIKIEPLWINHHFLLKINWVG